MPARGDERKSFLDVKLTPTIDPLHAAKGEMRADADEVANLLNIKAMVEQIREAKRQGILSGSMVPRSIQQSRLLCLWKLLIASQEVRKANAAIDFELANSYTSLDKLMVRQNMTINLLNTANFLQGGVIGTIKQSMGLSTQTARLPVRQEIAITSFSTGTLLSLMNLAVPYVYRRKIEAPPNSLVPFFNSDRQPNDADKSYLWKFLNTPVPGEDATLTRRQILVKHWQSFSGLNLNDETALKKLATSATSENLSENIGIVAKRIGLLHDLRTHIEEFDGCLYELHREITGGK